MKYHRAVAEKAARENMLFIENAADVLRQGQTHAVLHPAPRAFMQQRRADHLGSLLELAGTMGRNESCRGGKRRPRFFRKKNAEFKRLRPHF
ncbi:MAG TPA: hypothetical protein VFX37_14980 [Pseudolabrys sp.]|nr:hypothetical protein [Pseudolabrys sp.]